ncbi:MAG: helix-turn-helix transcriptional regulator [Actinomadura sp.]
MTARNVPVDLPRRRAYLRDFLRARRARLNPADVGMPYAGRRRTPGLRREEVAVLAGVGVSWYTWLEQGRDIKVSDSVLDAIGRALRLNQAERGYLYLLAGLNPPPRPLQRAEPLTPELQRVLNGWLPYPACVIDQHWDFRGSNEMAEIAFGYGDIDHNCLVSFFTNAHYRGALESWEEKARTIVGQFRADAARFPDDPQFERLAQDLCAVSPEFAELWGSYEVSDDIAGYKTINHPDVADLAFEYTALPLPNQPGYRVVLFNPKPGTMTCAKLSRLAAVHRLEATA